MHATLYHTLHPSEDSLIWCDFCIVWFLEVWCDLCTVWYLEVCSRSGVVRHGPLVSLCKRLHLNLVTIVFYSHRVSPHNSQPTHNHTQFLLLSFHLFNLHTLSMTHNLLSYTILSLALLVLGILYVPLFWHQIIPTPSSFFLKSKGSFLLFIFSSNLETVRGHL